VSTIYFIRHGQASFGKENYDELSERGYRQARLLAEHITERNLSFDVIYTGTLERQIKTADQLVSHLKESGKPLPGLHRHEGLNEYPTREIFETLVPFAVRTNPSLMNDVNQLMTDRRSFQKVFEAAMSLWGAGSHDTPGLLSWNEFTARVNAVVDDIMATYGTGRNVAVFTSGGPISVIVRRTLNLSSDDTMRVAEQIVNTSVSRFKCTEARITLFAFNEFSHLEKEKDSKLITYR
jgi:broad specificity phosphatase PhoE